MINICFHFCYYTYAVCIPSFKYITKKSAYEALCDSGTQAEGQNHTQPPMLRPSP